MTCHTDKYQIAFDIDDDDFIIVSHFSWRLLKGHPATTIRHLQGRRAITLSELLLGPAPDGQEWQPINGNPRDCHRANFHPTTPLRVDNKSGVTGVFWDEKQRRWIAELQAHHRRYHLGRFSQLADAIEARQRAEQMHVETQGGGV
jgi:hypothetical protein